MRTFAGITLSAPQPFIKMPITYERDQILENSQYHDWGARNPIGCGFVTKEARLEGKAFHVDVRQPNSF